MKSALTIAVVGNPNTGKSTLFNRLCGFRQRVGNYPGVTVEKKCGFLQSADRVVELIDLPGTYSLAPRSLDEMVVIDVLLGRQKDSPPVDAVMCVVDASNLQRNLYLVSQVLELGLPTILVLNMMDVAENKGISIDAEMLQQHVGTPVISVQATRGIGIDALKKALVILDQQDRTVIQDPMPEIFQIEAIDLRSRLQEEGVNADLPLPLVRRLLLDVDGEIEKRVLSAGNERAVQALAEARGRLKEAGHPVPGVETDSRHVWCEEMSELVAKHPDQRHVTWTDRIDSLLTHRFFGLLIFLAVMILVFQSVFTWAVPFMDWIDAGVGYCGEFASRILPEGMLQDLVVDGIIAGVGGVLIFLPQILILFLFLAILEDCGYMSRAAMLMDGLMSRVGLSGKSFIPLLSSFACAIPGIMATRIIEDRRDRLVTILVAPLMTCSARLPVYALLIAAFIPNERYLGGWVTLQGLVLMSLYLLGVVAAVLVALILKKTFLRGSTPSFVMELPEYKCPTFQTVVYRAAERAWRFLHDAGTMILAVTVLVWAALYFPNNTAEIEAEYAPRLAALEAAVSSLDSTEAERAKAEAAITQLQREIMGEQQRQSYLGRAGRAVEPVFRPIGWDWRVSCAVLASFPAREVVVATLGVLFNLGDEIDPESEEGQTQFSKRLHNATWDGTDKKVFTIPVAMSIMVFFALCAQCAATLAVIKRETNSYWWPAFTFTYMTVLAYIAAMITRYAMLSMGF